MVSQNSEYEKVLAQVETWPNAERERLAIELLRGAAVSEQKPKASFKAALGIARTTNPPPTDEEVEQILRLRAKEEYEK